MAVRFAHSWAYGASCSQVQHLYLAGGAVTSAQLSSRAGDWGVFSFIHYITFTVLLPSFGWDLSSLSVAWVSPQPCQMQRLLSRVKVICNQSWYLGRARGVLLFLATSKQSSNLKNNKAEAKKNKTKKSPLFTWRNIILHVIEAVVKVTWVIALYLHR